MWVRVDDSSVEVVGDGGVNVSVIASFNESFNDYAYVD